MQMTSELLATSVASLEAQMAAVKRFAERKFLRLTIQKCEIVMSSKDYSP